MKKIKILVLTFIVFLSLGLLAACAPNEYTLKYAASAGGSVTGKTEQVVEESKDGSTVVAVADFGYTFVKWSDGVTTAERTDKHVDGNVTVTAEFEFDNMTVMNHLINQMREKCFDFTMASSDKQEDIFIGNSENNKQYTLRNETYTTLELLEGICDRNELTVDTIYEYEIAMGEFTYNGKLQCKYYSGDSYRIYLTLEEEALLPNPLTQLIFVIYINIGQEFTINYLDYVVLFYNVDNGIIIEPQAGVGPYAGRFNFNNMLLMQGNVQCDKQELINYAEKFIDDILELIDKNVITTQLNLDMENHFWSYWVNTGEGYKLSVDKNGIQYMFENSFGGAFFYGNAPTITCVPDDGYQFVMWSDGVISPMRTDVKPTDGNTLILYAIVEKIN